MKMPMIGLGTWQLRGDEGAAVVTRALELGYRHLDTAQMYENEAEVGKGVRASSVPRDEIYVVTKIHQDRFADGSALQSAEQSIDKLGLGPADLILCHWPPRTVETEQVMDDLLAVQAAGLTKAVGVSNFNVSQMERAAACGRVETNQVEFHPLLDQSRLIDAAARTGMSLTAYMPIIRGEALTLPEIIEIAKETGREPAAVVLRWVIQQGVVALCNSTREDRLLGNLQAMEFELSDNQMSRITALTKANKRYSDMPGWSPNWDE